MVIYPADMSPGMPRAGYTPGPLGGLRDRVPLSAFPVSGVVGDHVVLRSSETGNGERLPLREALTATDGQAVTR